MVRLHSGGQVVGVHESLVVIKQLSLTNKNSFPFPVSGASPLDTLPDKNKFPLSQVPSLTYREKMGRKTNLSTCFPI